MEEGTHTWTILHRRYNLKEKEEMTEGRDNDEEGRMLCRIQGGDVNEAGH